MPAVLGLILIQFAEHEYAWQVTTAGYGSDTV
jgi:hypothetical protein